MQQQEMNDVIVVGAGIVGCAAACHLARSGLRVTLLDKGSTAGEASQLLQRGATNKAPTRHTLKRG